MHEPPSARRKRVLTGAPIRHLGVGATFAMMLIAVISLAIAPAAFAFASGGPKHDTGATNDSSTSSPTSASTTTTSHESSSTTTTSTATTPTTSSTHPHSVPDSDGKGMDRGEAGADTTDHNNGCGNDADREDDDNGFCGGQHNGGGGNHEAHVTAHVNCESHTLIVSSSEDIATIELHYADHTSTAAGLSGHSVQLTLDASATLQFVIVTSGSESSSHQLSVNECHHDEGNGEGNGGHEHGHGEIHVSVDCDAAMLTITSTNEIHSVVLHYEDHDVTMASLSGLSVHLAIEAGSKLESVSVVTGDETSAQTIEVHECEHGGGGEGGGGGEEAHVTASVNCETAMVTIGSSEDIHSVTLHYKDHADVTVSNLNGTSVHLSLIAGATLESVSVLTGDDSSAHTVEVNECEHGGGGGGGGGEEAHVTASVNCATGVVTVTSTEDIHSVTLHFKDHADVTVNNLSGTTVHVSVAAGATLESVSVDTGDDTSAHDVDVNECENGGGGGGGEAHVTASVNCQIAMLTVTSTEDIHSVTLHFKNHADVTVDNLNGTTVHLALPAGAILEVAAVVTGNDTVIHVVDVNVCEQSGGGGGGGGGNGGGGNGGGNGGGTGGGGGSTSSGTTSTTIVAAASVSAAGIVTASNGAALESGAALGLSSGTSGSAGAKATGSLPFTGGEAAGLSLVGLVLLTSGALALVSARRRRVPAVASAGWSTPSVDTDTVDTTPSATDLPSRGSGAVGLSLAAVVFAAARVLAYLARRR